MGRKTSIVWKHFTIPPLFPKKALCNYCRQLVCRGQANLGTTSLMNHLKRCEEFKASVLGIPRGVSDMMAAALTTADTQLRKFLYDETAGETLDLSASNDGENAELLSQDLPWPTTSVPVSSITATGNSSYNLTRTDDTPSRAVTGTYPDSNADSSSLSHAQDGRHEEKSSALLYGDISSTSEANDEPSSSTLVDVSITNPSIAVFGTRTSDLLNYSSNAQVDCLYGGIMLHHLYQQFQAGKYCDMRIVPQKLSSNEVMISETGKVTRKNTFSSSKDDEIIGVHSCVLGAMSQKVNSFVEMGCSTIHLKKGSSDSVKGLLEIVYTGKLDKIRTYSENQLFEILEVARFLKVDFAVQYLMRELPDRRTTRAKSNAEKLVDERVRIRKSTPTTYVSPPPVSAQSVHKSNNDVNNVTNRVESICDRITENLSRKRKVPDTTLERSRNSYSHHDKSSQPMPEQSHGSNSSEVFSKRSRKHAVYEMIDNSENNIGEENHKHGSFQPVAIKREVRSLSPTLSHMRSVRPPTIVPVDEFVRDEYRSSASQNHEV